MSNRVLWILILLWFFWIITAFYLYFFKYNRVNIEISSNLTSYQVELYSTDIKKTFKKKCEQKKCVFKDFSAFNYNLKITKEWYRDYYNTLNIRDNWITTIEVTLEKDIYLRNSNEEELNKYSTVFIEEIKKNTKENRIKELRERKKIKKTFFLKNLWKFIFKKSKDKLELLINDKSLWLFENTNIETLNIRKISYTDNFILINIWDKKYIYNLISKNFFIIKLNLDINYIKLWENNQNFRLVTDKWTFIYSTINKELKYFSLFKDYEIIWDNYIWIIYPDELEKFKNYWYKPNKKESFIIKYNKKSHKKDVIYKTDIKMSKILKIKTPEEKDNLFLTKGKDNNSVYELMNY